MEALADGKQEMDILEVGVVRGVVITPGDNHHPVNELLSNKATLVASAAVTQITFCYYITKINLSIKRGNVSRFYYR